MSASRYRIKQDGMAVAWTDSPHEIMHYAMVYGQDGPVEIEERWKGRWRSISAPPKDHPHDSE